MKGLLIKDLKLAFVNQRIFYLLASIVFLFFMCRNDGNVDFIASFIVAVCLMLVISTISYDDYDRGLLFLFTLPVNRKLYVTEKYVFGLLSGCAGLLLSIVLIAAFNLIHGRAMLTLDFLGSIVVVCAVLLAMLAVIIPVRLKFGENGRIFLLLSVGVCFGVGASISAVLSTELVDGIFVRLAELSETAFILILYIIAAIVLVISWMISVRIMEKKSL